MNTIGPQETLSAIKSGHDKFPESSFSYGKGQFNVSSKGVFFTGQDKDGVAMPPAWICSPLIVGAKTRDEKNEQWGCMLEWHDDDGQKHQWAMPCELLEGDGGDIRRELAQRGLQIAPSGLARTLLLAYIKTFPVDVRLRCVDRLGWHGDTYVTPDGGIGKLDERIVFQSSHAIESTFSAKGRTEEWTANVASLAQGNSRLMFAIAAAFAGPLAEIVGEDSGGFHFRGASSSGKSTTLKVAASVWGAPRRFVGNWRSTINGMEGLAAFHNDSILILDEISQADPLEVGNTAYLLANGQGKTRATRTGLARPPMRWRTLFLSAGEVSLASLMSSAGKKASAGQEIRLADIESDAGADMGIFEVLHGHANGAALSAAIKTATDNYHGAVGQKWLHLVVEYRHELPAYLLSVINRFVDKAIPKSAPGQAERVARRFALVAAAGERATHYGLTGWREGDAFNGALACFNVWLESFGANGSREDRTIVSQVLGFIEEHGASRFEDLNATSEQRVPNRAGYYRDVENGIREYLIPAQSFGRILCKGLDEKASKKALIEAGILIPGKDGRPSQSVRVPGQGSARLYVLRSPTVDQ